MAVVLAYENRDADPSLHALDQFLSASEIVDAWSFHDRVNATLHDCLTLLKWMVRDGWARELADPMGHFVLTEEGKALWCRRNRVRYRIGGRLDQQFAWDTRNERA